MNRQLVPTLWSDLRSLLDLGGLTRVIRSVPPKCRLAFAAALALVVLGTGVALAEGGYDLSWWTVAGGGGTSTSLSPGYSLSGAAGQPAAGELSGTGFHLSGGFWVGAGVVAPPQHYIYVPLVIR